MGLKDFRPFRLLTNWIPGSLMTCWICKVCPGLTACCAMDGSLISPLSFFVFSDKFIYTLYIIKRDFNDDLGLRETMLRSFHDLVDNAKCFLYPFGFLCHLSILCKQFWLCFYSQQPAPGSLSKDYPKAPEPPFLVCAGNQKCLGIYISEGTALNDKWVWGYK